jgi:hypothetical protein
MHQSILSTFSMEDKDMSILGPSGLSTTGITVLHLSLPEVLYRACLAKNKDRILAFMILTSCTAKDAEREAPRSIK